MVSQGLKYSKVKGKQANNDLSAIHALRSLCSEASHMILEMFQIETEVQPQVCSLTCTNGI